MISSEYRSLIPTIEDLEGLRVLDCFQSTSGSPCPPSSPPVGPLSLTTRPEDQQPPSSTPSSVKQEDARVSSGSEDDEARHAGPIPPGFSLVPSPMFGHGIMYMSHYLPPRGPAGCPTSMLADERRKRNRTFIDPVTEVPRLEYWFKRSTHPSHAVRIAVNRPACRYRANLSVSRTAAAAAAAALTHHSGKFLPYGLIVQSRPRCC